MKNIPRFRCVLKDHLKDYITAITWSIDGSLFLISASGELLHLVPKESNWNRHSFHPETESNNEPSSLSIPPQSSQEITSQFTSLPQKALNCIGISNNGQFLAVGGQAGKLWIWEVHNSKHKSLQVHEFGSIWLDQLAWNPIKPILATAVGTEVYLWEKPFIEPFLKLKFETSTVLNLSWHPEGKYLAVGGHHGVKIWDIQKPVEPTLLEVPGASLCSSWSPKGTFLASGNLDRTISVLHHSQPPPWLMQGFPGKVSHIDWMQSTSLCLAAAASDGITIWTQKTNKEWQNRVLTGHKSLIRDIAFQPQGKLLVSAGDEKYIKIWSEGKKLQQTIDGPAEGTHCLAWNPTGQMLATGGINGEILIFNIQNEAKGFT